MDSAPREARLMARERDNNESMCYLVLLPLELKRQIMSHISTQRSLSRLGQSCRSWHEVANEELYRRDSREQFSYAIKWMAAHAVDEQTTASAIRTLEISLRWGGQIDAVKQHYSRSDAKKKKKMYDLSTALHVAVFLGNVRLTKKLLDMKASLTIPCPVLSWVSMGTQQLRNRFAYFQKILEDWDISPVFPIFLAFLQSNIDMCKLLIEHGAGREATILGTETGPQVMSILHFAAADPTTDYRQWQCLFDSFRDYIDEPCPRRDLPTPLHVALENGCTQGMQIAVEFGADKEARNGFSHTPLSSVAVDITDDNPRTFEERTVCIRKFVELGASLNSEVDSLLLVVVRSYVTDPVNYPLTRQLIYFLLEHRADIHGIGGWQNTNMVNEIVNAILDHGDDPEPLELLKELLSDLVDTGLNFTTPSPGLPSPLSLVLNVCDSDCAWLLHLLCANGATVHEDELEGAFICWCHTSQMWEKKKYDAWWLHQGQEDEIFQKWCEHPYNVWWWQHVEDISPHGVSSAYTIAFGHKDRHLYDVLTHLPRLHFTAPSGDLLLRLVLSSPRLQLWAWKLVVLHEFEDDFVATWAPCRGNNLIHFTVYVYRAFGADMPYSAADAIHDILYLRDKGVDVTARSEDGRTPLEDLLRWKRDKDVAQELAAVLRGEEFQVQEPA